VLNRKPNRVAFSTRAPQFLSIENTENTEFFRAISETTHRPKLERRRNCDWKIVAAESW